MFRLKKLFSFFPLALSHRHFISPRTMADQKTIMAIDVWAQQPTEKFLKNPIFASLNRWNKKRGQDQQMGGEEQQLLDMVCQTDFLIQQMDMGRAEKSLICAWYNFSGEAWISNEQVLQFASEHPKRLFPVLSHSFLDPLQALQDIRSHFQESSTTSTISPIGVRIIPWLLQTTIDDRRFYPTFAYLTENKIPLFIQVGWTGPLRSSEFGRPIPYLERVLLHFPDLTVICGHVGQPWLTEVIFLTSKFENVYIDTSAYKPTRFPEELKEFIKSKR